MSRLRERFGRPADDGMRRFSSSLELDLRMLDEDVDGSLAQTEILEAAGVLRPEEARTLREALERTREELRSGAPPFVGDDEDVHMAVERRVTELAGDAGRKLHTGRSRNDQVATDVRLWLKRRLGELEAALSDLLATLLGRVERDGRMLIPGYTHLQRGQPIRLGHHLLAHAWALSRDRGRLAGALERLDRCPLGAGALAGTPYPVDRQRAAAILGFAGVVENAMDAVSAQDHVQEVAAACAIAATHLSRMAEELVLWSSSEFALVRLSDEHATGSSLMPHKRNPDGAELVRGRTARVHGALHTLLTLARGLPLSYNRDFQEGREVLFDTVEATTDCARLMAAMWRGLAVRPGRFEGELAGDFSLATELADLLVSRGVPFREAHGVVARIVRHCEERGADLAALTPEDAAAFHPALASGFGAALDPEAAAERRSSHGGTAQAEIDRQVALLRARLRPATCRGST